jgi:signal transduction histidine kinase
MSVGPLVLRERRDGKMNLMRRLRMPVMWGDEAETFGPILRRFALAAAEIVSLLVLLWALANGFFPTWPLWTIIAILAAGLVAGPLAQLANGRSAHRFAQTAAAAAALFVLVLWLPEPHPRWHVQPLWVVALLLSLGLVVEPLAKLINGESVPRSVQPIAAIAATFVLIQRVSIDGYYFYTTTPTPLHNVDRFPMGGLRAVIVILFAGFVVGQLVGRQAVRTWVQTISTVVALGGLVLTLASSPTAEIHPERPLWWMVVFLGGGLAIDLMLAFVPRPPVKVLAERVNELSRTRRGALDVQATELRRIERDLHDGAQVRLVALSLKLGRAEERYRDDPETAAFLREARGDALDAIRELRELARGIAPPVLADRGLEAAVRSLAQRSGSEVSVTSKLKRRPQPAVETAAYFVVAESLTNAAKHASGAAVEVRLDERAGDLVVEVTDCGPGGADPAGGGLNGLRQRVEALDGALHVRSQTGVGTRVEAVMSCGW